MFNILIKNSAPYRILVLEKEKIEAEFITLRKNNLENIEKVTKQYNDLAREGQKIFDEAAQAKRIIDAKENEIKLLTEKVAELFNENEALKMLLEQKSKPVPALSINKQSSSKKSKSKSKGRL